MRSTKSIRLIQSKENTHITRTYKYGTQSSGSSKATFHFCSCLLGLRSKDTDTPTRHPHLIIPSRRQAKCLLTYVQTPSNAVTHPTVNSVCFQGMCYRLENRQIQRGSPKNGNCLPPKVIYRRATNMFHFYSPKRPKFSVLSYSTRVALAAVSLDSSLRGTASHQ